MTRIPELGALLDEVLEIAPRWVTPHYDFESNPGPSLRRTTRSKSDSTYIDFYDYSQKVEVGLLQKSPWPIAEIQKVESSREDAGKFRGRVDHPGREYWHEALPIHRSSYLRSGAIILPVFGTVSDYRCSALALLYAFSIVVRYMPSAWRRVEGGDWDRYLPLVEMAVDVCERVLPEEFLAEITGDQVHTRQPGSFF